MDFADTLSKIEGAQSVGGQMIVNKDGTNILVGKQVQGMLIVEDTDEARAVVFEATGVKVGKDGSEDDSGPKPVHHEVKVDDKVETKDATNKK